MNAPHVIAHRGSSARYPDNSWAAFKAAVAEGADAIECDVQATRDRVFVIRHDLAIGDRVVADLSVGEVEAREPEIVRLADLLVWAQRVDIDLLVEVKDPDAALGIAAAVAASASCDRIVLGAFHAPALVAVKSAAPRVRTSFMMGSVVGAEELVHLAAACGADGVHLCWESRAPQPHRLLGAGLVGRLQSAGLAVTLWHEEREDELRALVASAPDAICTNTPSALRRIVDEHCALSGIEASGSTRATAGERLVENKQSARQEES